MIAPTFEIKIALLGNVSAGKTTVLNALFCDKFSEVSMKRTTAGINFFRVHVAEETSSSETTTTTNPSDASASSESLESFSAPTTTRTAKSILKEISQDNVKLRMGEEIQEKIFDIEIKQELVTMRKDTKLVFVDIPGINEANVVNKYKDYVTENWETFDCVMVVMDARLGVNTEDQVFLLSFVKEQLKKKDIPIIVLCNKVDDPEDEEQAALVHESRKEVEKLFAASCREKALTTILKKSKADGISLSPAFIPVSAIHAFIHQSASLMSRESFNSFDKDLLEKLGREQIGRRRWNRLSEEQKYDEAYKVIKEGHQDGLEDSNFDKLLSVLQFFLGGDDAQRKVIELQVWTAIRSLSKRPLPPGGLTALIKAIYEKRKSLQASSKGTLQIIASMDLVKSFWTEYNSLEDEFFGQFVSNFPNGVNLLSVLMRTLVDYHKLACLPDWKELSARVVEKMDKLIQRYYKTLIDLQQKDWEKSTTVEILTPHDWPGVWGSLLLLSFSKTFNEFFGQEKIVFERLFSEANNRCRSDDSDSKCPTCRTTLGLAHNTQNKCCHPCKTVYAEALANGSNVYCPRGCNRQCNYTSDQCYCSSCYNTYNFKNPIKAAQLEPWYNAQDQLLPYRPSNDQQPSPRIIAPRRFSDPSHMAHIVWMFCNFLESLEADEIPIRSHQAPEETTPHMDGTVERSERVAANDTTNSGGTTCQAQTLGDEASEMDGDY